MKICRMNSRRVSALREPSVNDVQVKNLSIFVWGLPELGSIIRKAQNFVIIILSAGADPGFSNRGGALCARAADTAIAKREVPLSAYDRGTEPGKF